MGYSQVFWRVTTVILGIGTGWLIISCTSGPQTTRYVLNQPDRAIGMEVTYREGSIEYSHPATLTPEMLDQALQYIEVQPSSLLDRLTGGSSTTQEAFSEEQRRFFADHLSRGLNQATPLETVTFYWAISRKNGIWELTSGGVYLHENTLHLVLPNYRQTFPAKGPPQIPRDHPLSRIGESLHSLKAISPARQITHGLATELWSPQTPHFVFPLEEFSKVPKNSVDQQALPANPPLNFSESSKQRLQMLEELRQEGLLSDEEYQDKRQEILKEL